MNIPNVLMIANGADIHSLRRLNWLLKKGGRVVVSGDSSPLTERQERYAFVPFPNTRGGRVLPTLFGETIGARLFRFFGWVTVRRLKQIRRRFRPAIVHVHWVDDRAYYCAKAGLRPLVLTVYGSDINNCLLPGSKPASRQMVGEALAGADVVLIDSADMHEKCTELAGRAVPTELITLGVDTDLFRPGFAQAALEWRRRLDIPAEAIVLLSMRGWSQIYRQESILEAFAQALPRLKSQAVLVFKSLMRHATDRARYEKKMRDMAVNLGVEERVRWMEEVPMHLLPEVYSFADAILNYPSMDAFPVTFLEAAACECPVISCRLPAYAGTFAQEYFHLVSPDDLSEMSDAIVEFVNQNHAASSERLHELRQIVCRNYDEEIVSGQLLDIYRRLSSPS